MKKRIIASIIIILTAVSCNIFKEEIDVLRNNLQALQEQIDKMNSELSSLQKLMQAM